MTKLSNVSKKKKKIIEYDKNTVTCNVGITQCDNGTVKCKKKIGYHQMWQKYNYIWY